MTALSDSVKLDLKRQLEIQSQCLEEYALNDVPEYPGWTFMLSDVTQAYGTCPFLNICDDARNQRVAWLESQVDQGATYHAAVRAVLDDFQELQQCISEQRNAIVAYVAAHIPAETVDRICQAIHAKKVSKCQSKHSRDQWNRTVEELDALATDTGIDMARYVQVVTGYTVRYKPAAAESEAFVNLYVQFQKLNTLLHSKTVQQAAVKDVAKSALVTLIQHNFMIQQTGRYYKKWSSLTSEKKMDRVRSYCSWFVRSKCLPMHIVDGMVEFVSTQMANKSIRSSDIQWSSKLGIIEDIPTIELADDPASVTSTSFTVKSRPKVDPDTSVSSTAIAKRVRKRKQVATAATAEDYTSDFVAQINRLILFEIVSHPVVRKSAVLDNVLQNIRIEDPNQVPAVKDLIQTKLVEMVKRLSEEK